MEPLAAPTILLEERSQMKNEVAKINLLELSGSKPRRTNQFARNNPALQQALDNNAALGVEVTQADISEVIDICLNKLVSEVEQDKLGSSGFIAVLAEMETHKTKIAKMRADTESVLINVATPTAIRQIINEIGMCIKTGTEEAVATALTEAGNAHDEEVMKQIGGEVYGLIMQKIQKMGYEDTSLARMLAAPR